MATKIDNYWNRFDEGKGYVELLYRDGYGAQGSEQNEMQSIINARIAKLARALFKDGDIINGAQIVVNPENGHVTATSGEVCLAGQIWSVPAAEFDIPVSGSVAVGVRLVESIISELEDPGLRNPAVGSRGEGEPGAWRRKIVAVWGYGTDGGEGTFYPVYTVDDGVQRAKGAPPSLDSFNMAIAKYDRDSTGTGTYVVSGLTVVAGEDLEDGRQVYHLGEGRARVGGTGVELNTSRRMIYDAQPDLRTVSMEIVDATEQSCMEGGQRIDVAHTPLKDVNSLRITVEEVVTVVHGAYSGAADDLPFTGVVSILEVRQLETTFEPTLDYVKKGDQVDWSPLGSEPAPGSSYQVRCRYIKDVLPEKQDLDGFSVSGAVAGTQIMYGYTQMLPRYDRLAIDHEGLATWFRGIASERNPQKPTVPESLLALATVYQDWRPGRTVSNDGVRVVPFDDIALMNQRIDYALQEIARQRLEADVNTRESGARVGVFVDPLWDDSMRDQGIEQTAAIIDGDLTLPVGNAASHGLPGDVADLTSRPFTVKVLLEQPYRTADMAVNPYMAFEPLPAKVALNPAIDQWTETQTTWTSAITRQFKASTGTGGGSGWAVLHHTETSTTTQTVSSTTTQLEHLRQIDVAFELSGFGPGEVLARVTFDGVDVTDSVSEEV